METSKREFVSTEMFISKKKKGKIKRQKKQKYMGV